MNVMKKTSIEVLHFLVLNKIYACLDLTYVEKILLLQSLELLPEAPPYIAGLMNYAGKTIPVIDLALRLQLKRTEPYSLNTPIVICNNNSLQFGIIIDHIYGLSLLKKEDIHFHKNFNSTQSLFSASAIIESKLALLLNIDHLFEIHELTEKDKSFLDNNTNTTAVINHD